MSIQASSTPENPDDKSTKCHPALFPRHAEKQLQRLERKEMYSPEGNLTWKQCSHASSRSCPLRKRGIVQKAFWLSFFLLFHLGSQTPWNPQILKPQLASVNNFQYLNNPNRNCTYPLPNSLLTEISVSLPVAKLTPAQ